MKESDFGRFGAMLAMLGATFGVEADTPLVSGYWAALRDLDAVNFSSACDQALKTLKFFPKPLELRELAIGNTRALNATDAWVIVAKRAGDPWAPKCTDPLAAKIVGLLGGYKRLGQMRAGEFDRARREFEEKYTELAKNRPALQQITEESTTVAS